VSDLAVVLLLGAASCLMVRGVLRRKRSESRRYRPTSASAIGEGYSVAWGEDKGRNMTATVRRRCRRCSSTASQLTAGANGWVL
jgi:hypothetical protein